MSTVQLTAPNGAKVSVDSGRVDNLLRRGFTKAGDSGAAKTTTAKKASTSSKKKS